TAPTGSAGNDAPGSVDRADRPHDRRLAILDAEFLAEQAVVGIAAADFRAQEFLDLAVGHGHGTGVGLGFDPGPMAEPPQGHGARLARQVLGEIEDLVGPGRYGLSHRHRGLPWRLTGGEGRVKKYSDDSCMILQISTK